MRSAFAYDMTPDDEGGTSFVESLLGEYDDAPVEARDIRVLILEDDDNDYRIVHRTLQLLDTYRVEAHRATTPEDGLELAAVHEFDVVLVDFWLGVDTGVGAIREFGGRIGRAAPILLTGMPGQDIRQLALRAGAIYCLDKNHLNPVLLETTIRCALHTHALEMRLQKAIIDLDLASRSKTNFFARIGHDLKTPLNAVLGYAEIISSQIYGPLETQKYAECAENIRAGGTHLLEVLNNLIHHSASQSSYSGDRRELASLGDVVTRALSMVEVLAQAREHRIDFEPPEEPVIARCQPAVLSQAILNVLSNAVKYTGRGGHIRISIEAETDASVIRIADNGIGMSKEDIELAMLPFHRVDLPPELAQDGTGIGLPIVADIMAIHDGRLDIESTPGAGTTVILRLPAVKAEVPAA